MAFTLKTHERDRKNASIIAKTHHYIRVSMRDQVPLYFQDGDFYSEDGKVQTSPPDWAIEQMNSLSKKAKATVKYKDMKVNGND